MSSPYYVFTSWEPCNVGTCGTCRTAQPGTAYPYMTGAFANSGINLAAACFADLPVHVCGDSIMVVTVSCGCSVVTPGRSITVPIVDNGPASPCALVQSPCNSSPNQHLIDLTKFSFSQLAPISLGYIPVLVYS